MKIKRSRLAVIAASAVAVLGLTAGIAYATAPPVTNNTDAISALSGAEDQIDAVKAYLQGGGGPIQTGDITAQAVSAGSDAVTVSWSTTRTDITGWTISRDGHDTNQTWGWSEDESSPSTLSHTFNLLVTSHVYTFTIVGHTASGDRPAVTVQANPGQTGTTYSPVYGTGTGGTGGTTNPPPTTTTTTTVAPPPTTTTTTTAGGGSSDPNDPTAGTSDEAAVAHSWGTPIAAGSDDFNGSAVDTSKWYLPGECWGASSTVVAGRCASHDSVHDGYLDEHGTTDGKTGYLGSNFSQKYGKWEVRMRLVQNQAGQNFHPVLIAWPYNDAWPSGAEYDYLESDFPGDTHATAFMHHPTQSGVVQDQYTSGTLDLTQWHNYAFEWTPTALKGYIDGQLWFTDSDPNAQAPAAMKQTIQLDNFNSTSGMADVDMEVDWARVYAN